MIIYYVRCSTAEQNEDRQIEAAKKIGAEKIYIDKMSGKDMNRPQLKAMLSFIREGDIVYCYDVSRIARNTQDFLKMVELFNSKGVEFVSQKENIDTSTPQGKFMLTVFAAMAQLERECIRQRQKEGIEIAHEKGVKFGRPPAVKPKNFDAVVARWRNGEITAVQAMKETGLTRCTFYKLVKQ